MEAQTISERRGYRPEIDGLRAIAVVGVVFFHANLGIRGGFVGVDVFFVISGFLITSIAARDIDEESFSLTKFWARRIRRILPAATVMVAVVSLVGFCLLLPSDFERVMRSAFWQAALVANHFFQQEAGYFSEQAETKPLLHTWSLAVEEQFYLLFPPILVAWRRYVSGSLLWPTLTLAAVSLAACVWQTPRDEASAFFLLPFRAWELLTGAILALAPCRGMPKRLAELLSLSGVALIVASMLLYTRQTPFPGWTAIIPVLGSAAFLFGCANQQTLAGRLLSLRGFVAVGRISYSLYLWHWPLIAFASLTLVHVGRSTKIGLVVISVLLSIASYHFVEQPFRRSTLLIIPGRAFVFAAGAIAPVLVVSAIVLKADGFRQFMDQATTSLNEDVVWSGVEYVCQEGRPVSLGISESLEGTCDFVLWGDSHSRVAAFVFDEVAQARGLCGKVFATPGTPPVPGVERHSKPDQNMTGYNLRILRYIIDSDVRAVVLVSRWSAWCSGRSDAEVRAGESRFDTLLMGVDDKQTDSDNSAKKLRRQLRALLNRLTQAGKTVWILQQVPECGAAAPARDFLKARHFRQFNPSDSRLPGCINIGDHEKRQETANWVLSVAEEFPAAHVVDPAPGFFDEQGVLRLHAERSHYRDYDHLTRFGATRLLGPYVEQILEEVAESKGRGATKRSRSAPN